MGTTAPNGHVVRRYRGEDWPHFRDLRLEMLADTPIAYVETLEAARRCTDGEWRTRTAWADAPEHLGLAAIEPATGRWVGMARCGRTDNTDARTFVSTVYVAPAHRGRGVADDLLGGAEEWARAQGHPELWLYVHEDNARAIAFYRRRGYDLTGVREPYPLDPSQYELVLRKPLAVPAA